MAYFVIGDDGQKYGPADISTLNQWIAENRLVRSQLLEEEGSGNRMAASSVPGLLFPMSPAEAPAAGYPGSPGYAGAYPRAGGYSDDGSADLQKAWIFGVIGLLCCAPFGFAGLSMANRAQAKGNPGAIGAKILNIVVIAIMLLSLLAWVLILVFGGSRALPGNVR